MIARVAAASGQLFRVQLLESYALTLHTFLQLEDERRLNRLLEEGDRLSLGGLVAVAFNEPSKLALLHQRYQSRLKGKPSREYAFKRASEILMKEAVAMQKEGRTQ